ncbi:MAG: RluA family pseudouridine synthase [Patescibacteria group bacterium]
MIAKTSTSVNNTLTVTSDSAGQRLDKFLTEKWPDQTRSQIQKLIKSGAVLVNGEAVAVHHFLKEKDEIQILQAQALQPARPSEKTNQINKKPTCRLADLPITIIAETDGYIVLHKPAGLLVHEGARLPCQFGGQAGEQEPTLVDWLLKKYPAITKIGEDPVRPGIVHRLDREVSGLMVVAKTQDMFDHLKKQFRDRTIKKEYTALVNGHPAKEEDEITFNIDRSETRDFKMAAVPRGTFRGVPTSGSDDRGRHAITQFEVIKRLVKYTLLKVRPRTGRTHQIRVHLNAYGLPIVGDLVYCPTKIRAKNHLPSSRIFLQAAKLGFTDLTGQWREFSEPLDPELNQYLGSLK